MNVGVLELVSFTVPPEWRAQWAAGLLRRHLTSVMPQVVSVWARQLGHRTHQATYYGQADPLALLPDDLDVVFVSCATQASALAYALAKRFRAAGVRTVLGGPHAKCFPADAGRFFDVVVSGACDRELVRDLLTGQYAPGDRAASAGRVTEFPSVEERLPELRAAMGSAYGPRVVGLLASVGCPYTCNFCTEWNVDYAPLAPDRLAADLRAVVKHFPGALVGYHDPNFAVRFDQTLDAIESAGPPHPRYAMNCSLSVLKDDRLTRLKPTNCVFVAPGIESWYDYGNKAAAGGATGRAKLEYVVERLHRVRRFVPGMQANFIFGTDEDAGPEPADLTAEFVRRVPFAWPNVNIPTPYGGTPLFDRYLAEGRILRSMPLAFYCAPYLTSTLKHYDPVGYYEHLVRVMEAATNVGAIVRRVGAANPLVIRAAHLSQSLSYRAQVGELRDLRDRLRTDRAFRAFHENRGGPLPEFYHHRFEQRLGRYAELLPRTDRVPVLEQGVPMGGGVRPAL
jgi:hypothetical protein